MSGEPIADFHFQWIAIASDNSESVVASGDRHRLTSAELGKTIKVRVTFKAR